MHRRAICLASLLLAAPAARPTWSIVLADADSNEVAIGTVTCLTNFDLLAIVPVVVVERGAAACQAAGDFDGIRRPVLADGLIAGDDPAAILADAAQIGGHQQRLYGIVDTQGRSATFTGSQTFAWAGGVTGSIGTLHYAIQGNILAGPCVVEAIETALLTTDGDVPALLMAGMEAARDAGGDGRCSCSSSAPTSCGCPPGAFAKSGHIGGMIVARPGDGDDPACTAGGCADGDYFMELNVAFQSSFSPDPVDQLRGQFDDWREELVGRPDAVVSEVLLAPAELPADGAATSTMTIVLRDWTDAPIVTGVASLAVEQADGSPGVTAIGTPQDLGGGIWQVELSAGAMPGIDVYDIVVVDGTRPVELMPRRELAVTAIVDPDVNGDGAVNIEDLNIVLSSFGQTVEPGTSGDATGDGTVDLDDLNAVLAAFGASS